MAIERRRQIRGDGLGRATFDLMPMNEVDDLPILTFFFLLAV